MDSSIGNRPSLDLREDLLFWETGASKILMDPRLGIQYSLTPLGFDIVTNAAKYSSRDALVDFLSNKYNLEKSFIERNVDQFFSKLDKNFLTIASTRDRFPLWVKWHITDYCNLKCRHCYMNSKIVNFRHPTSELSREDRFRILDKILSHADYVYFHFSGGEVLTCPDFVDMLDYIPHDKASISFFTNGTLIALWLKKLERIDRSKFHEIYVSILGVTDETNKSIRGIGVRNVIKGIESLVEMGFPVELSFNVYRGNLHELDAAIELCLAIGVKNVTYNIIENRGRADPQLLPEEYLSTGDRLRLFDRLKQLEDRYGSQIVIKNTLDPMRHLRNDSKSLRTLKKIDYSCSVFDPWKLQVGPRGEVHLCYELGLFTDQFYVGNLRDDELSEITRRKKELATGKAHDIRHSRCGTCEFVAACRGSCIVQVLRENKIYFQRTCLKGLPNSQ